MEVDKLPIELLVFDLTMVLDVGKPPRSTFPSPTEVLMLVLPMLLCVVLVLMLMGLFDVWDDAVDDTEDGSFSF